LAVREPHHFSFPEPEQHQIDAALQHWSIVVYKKNYLKLFS
jgi:hypothetical protein